MTPRNHLRKYRKKASLTQTALADLIGANQQLIQRIEAGVTPPKTIVAEKIASQLNLKVHQIFPRLKNSIDAIESPDDRREADGLEHFYVMFFFKNGKHSDYVVPGPAIGTLYEKLENFWLDGENTFYFSVFDTDTHRVGINPRLLSHWTVVKVPGPSLAEVDEADLDEETAFNVLFSNGNWKTYSAEPDCFSIEDNKKEFEAAQGDLEMYLGDFFHFLADQYQPVSSFVDRDGNVTYFQKEDMAEVHIALRFVRPVLDDADDGLDENE